MSSRGITAGGRPQTHFLQRQLSSRTSSSSLRSVTVAVPAAAGASRRTRQAGPILCRSQPFTSASSRSEATGSERAGHANGRLENLQQSLTTGQRAASKATAALLATLITLTPTAAACFAPWSAEAASTKFPCEDVEQYYAGTQGLKGEALKAKLHDIIKGHKVYTYTEAWDALKILDAADQSDPAKSRDVVEIYTRRAVPKDTQATPEGWNREHLWPRSYGLTQGRPEFSDLHILRPADVNVNSARGNKWYGECTSTDGTCMVPANREAAADTATNKDVWTPPTEVRGDIARALLYMAVRYDGSVPGELDLELSDNPKLAEGQMGLLTPLLKWHALDPPSSQEATRNARVCSLYQHNRNPFVDHPEFVSLIWTAGPASAPAVGSGAGSGSGFSLPGAAPPVGAPVGGASGAAAGGASGVAATRVPGLQAKAWFNEIHYSNEGPDKNEFIEVVVSPGVDPSTLTIYLYNGANGKTYGKLPLSKFNLPPTNVNGFVVYGNTYAQGGLQNGPDDGMALVSQLANGPTTVIQFLSYDGELVAVDGPAKGFRSTDIGVKETDNSPAEGALGLIGVGKKYEDFKWSKFNKNASPGRVNFQSNDVSITLAVIAYHGSSNLQQRQQRRQHRHEEQAWEEDSHVGEQERRRPSKEREAKPTRKKKESGGSSSSSGKKAESNGPTIPEEFMCPLSLTVMTDPVIIASGQTYERASIERWFAEGKRTCPKSGVRIDHTNFCPNFALKSMISDWMAQGSGSHSLAARPSTAPAKKTVSQSEGGPIDHDPERLSDGAVRKKKVVKKKSADGGEESKGERGRKASGSGSGSDAGGKARARSVSPLPSNLSKKVAAMGGDGQAGDGPTDIKAVWDSIASQGTKPKKAGGGLQRHLSYFPRGEDGFGSPADDDDEVGGKLSAGVSALKLGRAGGGGGGGGGPGKVSDLLKGRSMKMTRKQRDKLLSEIGADGVRGGAGLRMPADAPSSGDADDAAPPSLRSGTKMRSQTDTGRKVKKSERDADRVAGGGGGRGEEEYGGHGEHLAQAGRTLAGGGGGGGGALPQRPGSVGHGRVPSISSNSSGSSSAGGRRHFGMDSTDGSSMGGASSTSGGRRQFAANPGDERPRTSGAAFGGEYGQAGGGGGEPWRGAGSGMAPSGSTAGRPKGLRKGVLKNAAGAAAAAGGGGGGGYGGGQGQGLERLTSSIPQWQADIEAMSAGRTFRKSPTNPSPHLHDVDVESTSSAGRAFRKSTTNPTMQDVDMGYGHATPPMTPPPQFPPQPPQGPSATGGGGGGAPGMPRLQRNSSARSTCSMMSMPGGSNDDPGGAPVRRDMGPMVEALNFGSGVDRRAAVRDIRTAIKGCPENKAQLVQLGGIEPLVEVIESDDLEAAEHAVAALMNLSLHWNASGEIVRAGGIPALVGMLNHGTAASQGNAAATLFALSKEDDHKLMVRASGAIPALISLLKTGTVRAKKDAALALFTLSTQVRCARDILKAGAVEVLLGMCGSGDSADPPPPGLEEKATAVLSNLARFPEGCQSVVECDGLTMFVDLLDEGSSARVKEDAASVLLQLAAMGFVTYGDLLAEGVLPSLVRVSQTTLGGVRSNTIQ
ncbi:unnamed protein product [Closterium sp. Yama58-4]|nr:unnamed protein product [Closterium sp. Yama58-4]